MDDKITITICGDGGCGKSSITLRVVRGQWTHEYDPTIEDSYSVTRTVDGTTYNLALTDTAGQEEYRGMWSASNLNSDAFLLVYDITSSSSLQDLNHFGELIEVECQNRTEAGRCWPALMVVGNKCDLQSMRQVGARDGLEWARARGYGFMETSAREMVNIEETFAAIVKRVVEARKMYAAGQQPTQPLSAAQSQPFDTPAPSPVKTEKSPMSSQPKKQVRVADEKQPEPVKKESFWSKLSCF